MAMARCNSPAVFIYGGSTLPGLLHGREVTILDVGEGVGAVLAGEMTREHLKELERNSVPNRRILPRAILPLIPWGWFRRRLALAPAGSSMIPAVCMRRARPWRTGRGKL